MTELEKAAECPFRFFLKRGLGLRPVDERERDRDVWLDPLTRGSELHDIYAAFLRKVRNENRRPTLKDADWLTKYAQDRLARIQEEMPASTPEILERETNDFLDDVRLFLEAEVQDGATKAVGLEVSFGRPLNGDEEPLARPDPVAISLGNGITLRIAGRIDRINEVGEATFEVLDYKTGGYWRDSWKGVFSGRASSAARALWTGCRRTAQGQPQEAEGARRSLLLLQPQRARRARPNRGPGARAGRCGAGRPARSDYQRPLHQDRKREGLHVLRFCRRV